VGARLSHRREESSQKAKNTLRGSWLLLMRGVFRREKRENAGLETLKIFRRKGLIGSVKKVGEMGGGEGGKNKGASDPQQTKEEARYSPIGTPTFIRMNFWLPDTSQTKTAEDGKITERLG